MRVLYDASLGIVDEGGIDGDDGLTYNLSQQMLPSIFQHLEKTEVLKLSPANVFVVVGVECSMSGDVGHFDDAVGSKQPLFPDCAEEYTDDLKHS